MIGEPASQRLGQLRELVAESPLRQIGQHGWIVLSVD